MRKKIYLADKDEVISLLGEYDKNARMIERSYGVNVLCRENPGMNKFVVEITGPRTKITKAYSKLLDMKSPESAGSGRDRAAGRRAASGPDTVYVSYTSKEIAPLSKNQKKYLKLIDSSDLVIAIGPAGTGKTFLAVTAGLAQLESGKARRIVLTRPVVESGERLGFLPGDLFEKINPYLKPLYDAFYTLLGSEKFNKYRGDGIIEIVPLAYMRGRTLEDAFIVLDEAQNTVPSQMKMFLTRIGFNSRVVITGDITQIDLEKGTKSGLVLVKSILTGVRGVKFADFSEKDVVRHRLVREIIKAYEKWEGKKR